MRRRTRHGHACTVGAKTGRLGASPHRAAAIARCSFARGSPARTQRAGLDCSEIAGRGMGSAERRVRDRTRIRTRARCRAKEEARVVERLKRSAEVRGAGSIATKISASRNA